MAVTVADVVGEQSFQLTCVIGHDNLHRQVDWVHVAEVNDPTPWLSDGVLLLTTGLVSRTDSDVETFFGNLAARGVAAVGFGVGMTADEVPDAWVRAAEHHRVPLLRVPLATPYIAIAEFVSRSIAATQIEQVRRMLDLQRRLVFSEHSKAEHLEQLGVLAREFESEVFRRSGDDLLSHGALDPAVTVHERSSIAAALRRHGQSAQHSTSASFGDLFVFVVSTSGSEAAIVRRRRFTPVEQSMLGSIALFIAVDHPGDRSASDPARIRSQLVVDIASGTVDASPEVRRLLFPSVSRVTCAALDLTDDTNGATRASRQSLVARVLGALRRAQHADAPPPVVAERNDHIVALSSVTVSDMQRALSFLADAGNAQEPMNIGISGPHPPQNLETLYHEALEALRATRTSSAKRVITFEQLPRNDLIAAWFTESRHLAPYAQWQRTLSAMDRDTRDAVLTALTVFLRENGAIERSAAELGIHRQTLHSRLSVVETSLEVSLDSATDRAVLWLALESGSLPGSPARSD